MIINYHRHSIRLKGYDYSQPGEYFITLVTHEREYLFGDIVDGEMHLNEFGEIVEKEWLQIPAKFGFVESGEFVIMPNHIHGIVIFHESVGAGFTPDPVDETWQPQTGQPQGLPLRGTHDIGELQELTHRRTLGNVVGAYKSLAANECLKIFIIKNETMGIL